MSRWNQRARVGATTNGVVAGRRTNVVERLEHRRLLTGNVITGTVFDDVNDNGVRDSGENVVPGITVELTNRTTKTVLTATADTNGVYTFDNLGLGVYHVDGVEPGRKLTRAMTVPSIGNEIGFPASPFILDLPTLAFNFPSPYVDQTFGISGSVATPIRDTTLAAFAQNDGNLLVVGQTALHRFTADGELDPTFGIGGTQPGALQGSSYQTGAIRQPDGKTLVSAMGISTPTLSLMRYNVDGTPDTTFGTNGILLTAFQGYDSTSMGVDSAGRIVFATTDEANNAATAIVGRLMPDGTPDSTFGPAGDMGVYSMPVPAGEYPYDLAVQSDNEVVADLFSPTQGMGFLARFTAVGALDSSFGVGGMIPTANSNTGQSLYYGHIGIGPGGKILVGGMQIFHSADTAVNTAVCRFNVNGTLDTSFGNQGFGRISIPITGAPGQHVAAAMQKFAIDESGAVIIGGSAPTASPAEEDFQIVRFLPNGQPDSNFGTAGKVSLPINENDTLGALAPLAGGKIMAIGNEGDALLNVYHIELARLLPGTIPTNPASVSGTVYSDANSNGLHDPAEPGVGAGWAVYVDSNNNKSPDANEPKTTTAADGSYTLSNLAAGPYTVRIVAPAGWTPTFPAAGNGQVFTLTDGESLGGVDFGLVKPVVLAGSIAGAVFNDINANGQRDAAELGSGGRTVYFDKNKNGVRDSGEVTVITATDGTFTFPNLSAGSYRIRETLPAGWLRTSPTAGYTDVTVAAGQIAAGANFGESQSSTISGSVYNDTNGNAKRDATEKGIVSRTVFIDKNKNGKLDTGEIKVLTAADGSYAFKSLLAGSYRIGEVLTAGWRRTSPAAGYFDVIVAGGKTSNGNAFAETTKGLLAGVVFKDTNGNGKQDAGEAGLAGWVLYLDASNNGKLDTGEQSLVSDSSGKYSFILSAGKYNLREVLKAGMKRMTPTAGVYAITLTSGLSVSGKVFGNR